mmetsp:Transcript_5649/g.17879  ORF Transcript_5649/g.17879 Transcript_5649/m.17879 type:complete len:318 (-) Transcript_5649:420-1373(-)
MSALCLRRRRRRRRSSASNSVALHVVVNERAGAGAAEFDALCMFVEGGAGDEEEAGVAPAVVEVAAGEDEFGEVGVAGVEGGVAEVGPVVRRGRGLDRVEGGVETRVEALAAGEVREEDGAPQGVERLFFDVVGPVHRRQNGPDGSGPSDGMQRVKVVRAAGVERVEGRSDEFLKRWLFEFRLRVLHRNGAEVFFRRRAEAAQVVLRHRLHVEPFHRVDVPGRPVIEIRRVFPGREPFVLRQSVQGVRRRRVRRLPAHAVGPLHVRRREPREARVQSVGHGAERFEVVAEFDDGVEEIGGDASTQLRKVFAKHFVLS